MDNVFLTQHYLKSIQWYLKWESTEHFKEGEDKEKQDRQVGNIRIDVWAYGLIGGKKCVREREREREKKAEGKKK